LASTTNSAGEPRVYYLDANYRVHELAWHADSGRWFTLDISTAGGSPAAAGSALTATTLGGNPRVYYLADDHRVQELAWLGSEWSYAPVSADAGVDWSAQQQIPGVTSSIGPSLAVFEGRLYAAWRGAGNDQWLWYASFDGTNWSAQQQIPGVASSIGPSLTVFEGKLYAAWKAWHDDQSLWYASFDGTNWSSQRQIPSDPEIPSVASSIGASLAAFGGKLYAAWKGASKDQSLWYASFDGTNWSSQRQIPGVSSSIGPSLTAFEGKLYAAWKGAYDDQRLWYASFDGANWSAQKNIPGFTAQDVVPAPSAGLHSFTNYLLYSYCKPIINISVDIYVFQDVVFQSSPDGQDQGFSFQLNAYSPQNEKSAWQQYCITLDNSTLSGGICNWTVNIDNPIIFQEVYLTSFPTPGIIPAGYHLNISLQNDAQGNVTAAIYTVTDNNGNSLANKAMNVTSADIAPITAFELNIVGPRGKQSSVLSSGAGRIAYAAQNVLIVLNQQPLCTEAPTVFTAEHSNCMYGDLLAIPDYYFWQSFNVDYPPKAIIPRIPRLGRPSPGLPVLPDFSTRT
jgi:hypothetical protein